MVQLKLLATTLLLAIVLSTGCVSRSTHQKVLDELSSTKGQLGKVESDRDAKKRRITELEGVLSTTKSDLETREAAEKQKEERINALLSDMKTTQAELLELRK